MGVAAGVGLILFLGALLMVVALSITIVGLWLLKGEGNSGTVRTVGAIATMIGVAIAMFGAYLTYRILFTAE